MKFVNENNKEVKFFVIEECLFDNFSGNCGVFIYLYDEGVLKEDDFKLLLKLENLEIEKVWDDLIEFWWNDLDWSEDKIEKYKV